MKRILIVTAFFPPAVGGIERTLERLAAGYGSQATVLTVPHPAADAFDREQPYTTVRHPFFTRWHYPHWFSLLATIESEARKARVEAIVFGHYAPYAWVGERLFRKYNIPSLIYCHGLDALSYSQTTAHRWLIRHIFKTTKNIVVNSDWTARQLNPYLDSENTTTLYPPLPASPHPIVPLPKTPNLLSIGRWQTIKGYDVAIQAIRHLLNRFPEIQYRIIGSGAEEQRYRDLIAKLQLAQHVILQPSSSEQELATAMDGARLFIQPSRSISHPGFIQAESFGLAAIEAAAAGRPVVATRVGGIPEAVREGETGLLVPPDDPIALADAIAQLLAKPIQLESLGRQAADWARQKFSYQRFLHQFAAALDDHLETPKVSICIPAYNTAATLEKCLKTLLLQDYPNLEWIVVDDGSTDATPAIAMRDGRVRVIRGQHQGAAAARNLAAQHATGELLYFSDADCLHEPGAISTLVRALQRHADADFAYSSFRLGWKTFRLQPFDPWALRERNYISTRALIRRTAFPGFDESLRRLQDWDLWLTMAERGKKGVWVNQVLYQQLANGTRTMSGRWFPKILYRFPALADRLSRGAGLSLREAEAIIRRKHHLVHARASADFVCPRCQTELNQTFPSGCESCGTSFQIIHGIPQLLHPSYFDDFKRQESVAHNELLGTDAIPTRDRYYHRQAKTRLRQLPAGSRVLEVAAGIRPDSFELAKDGFDVTITDIAADRVLKAQTNATRLGLPPVRFAVADAEHLPFRNESFDAVLTAASFHHFPHPQRALHELRRIVRPGGLIVLELEPQRWPYRTFFRWLKPIQTLIRSKESDVHHSIGDDSTEGFTAEQIQALIRNEGLILLQLQPVKIIGEFADQTARLVSKLLRHTVDIPNLLATILSSIDQILERLPAVRRLAWHWNVVARVP